MYCKKYINFNSNMSGKPIMVLNSIKILRYIISRQQIVFKVTHMGNIINNCLDL